MNRRKFMQIGAVGCGVIGAVFSYQAIRPQSNWLGLEEGHEVRITNRTSEPATVGLTVESVDGEVEWEGVDTVPAGERARRDTDLTAEEYTVTAEFAQGETLTDSYTTTEEWEYGGCDAIETTIFEPQDSPGDGEQPIGFGVRHTACD